MEPIRFGTTGLQVSPLCLGMMSYGDPSWRSWVLEESAAEPFVLAALDAGINFFDTANVYSQGRSEQITGALLARHARREEVVIATKVHGRMGDGPNRQGLSRKHVFDEVTASLRRLGTDYIDLYQVHRFDPDTPLEETLEALHDVVKAGWVRYLGASTMAAWQLAKALGISAGRGWQGFVSMQDHYNLLDRETEREMMPLCRDAGLATIPWSPLARGYLTRRPEATHATTRGADEPIAERLYAVPWRDAVVNAVCDVADERGVAPAQVALAWVASRPGVTAPIVGATKPHHLTDAIAAIELELSAEEVARLEAPYGARPLGPSAPVL
ncbi:MAG: aldo/keto reductase [Trueperaceae bacterium]|nr:aldo/keto reductase [Trueperaceae bacterium]